MADSGGNRTSSHKSATYGYQPFNRLVSTSTASYIYNNNGNMISKSESGGMTQVVWDFENRLIQRSPLCLPPQILPFPIPVP